MTAREEGSGFYGFNRFNGFNRGGAAHKNRKAPQNFGSASHVSSSRAKSRDLPCRTVNVLNALLQSLLASNP